MRPLLALSFLLVVAPALSAQLCYNPRPKPYCSTVVHTDFGAFALVSGDDWGNAPWREVVDWGVLFNTGERGAIGGSVVASLDRAGLLVGPELRYRRWLASGASLDFGVGLPIVSSTGNIESGVTGLVRWSPNDWLAVAARPEVLRWTTVTSCGPTGCVTANRGHARLSLGCELGHVPGAVMSAVGAAATLLLYSLVASID